MSEDEIWKTIPGYSNYEININGVIRRKKDKFIPKYSKAYKTVSLMAVVGV